MSPRRAGQRPTLPPKPAGPRGRRSAYSRGGCAARRWGVGGLAKRRCGIRQPRIRGGTECGKKAGLVPPKRPFPLPDFRVEGGCQGEGCRGEGRRGEPILPVPRAALSVEVRAAHTDRRVQRRGHAERDPPGTRRRAARLRERRCARRPPVRSEATQPDDGAVVSAMIGQAVSWSPLESGMDAQRRRGTGRREADPEGAKRSSPVRAARRQPARVARVSGANRRVCRHAVAGELREPATG